VAAAAVLARQDLMSVAVVVVVLAAAVAAAPAAAAIAVAAQTPDPKPTPAVPAASQECEALLAPMSAAALGRRGQMWAAVVAAVLAAVIAAVAQTQVALAESRECEELGAQAAPTMSLCRAQAAHEITSALPTAHRAT